MTDIIIEKMALCHIEEIARLEVECFSVPWSKNALESELDNNFARFYVAFYNGKIAGYIGAHNVLGEVYITNVAVFPEFRRKGIAGRLISALEKKMAEENALYITLEVRKTNLSAIALYEKMGFKEVGRRKNFYENPREDAVLMTHYLKSEIDL